MTAGLQIWNAYGGLILDGTSRCARIIGTQTLVAGMSGSFTDPRINEGNVFWDYQRDKTFHLSAGYGGLVSPTFAFTGNTLTWTYPPLNNPSYDEYAAGILLIGAY